MASRRRPAEETAAEEAAPARSRKPRVDPHAPMAVTLSVTLKGKSLSLSVEEAQELHAMLSGFIPATEPQE